jgi:hypothetical protein
MLVKIKHILIIKSILLSLNQCSTNAHQKNDNKIKYQIQALTFQDGILSANDLKAAFASVGRSISDGEASGMVGEAPGPVNFTQMVILFAEKMAGGKSLTSPNSAPIK